MWESSVPWFLFQRKSEETKDRSLSPVLLTLLFFPVQCSQLPAQLRDLLAGRHPLVGRHLAAGGGWVVRLVRLWRLVFWSVWFPRHFYFEVEG